MPCRLHSSLFVCGRTAPIAVWPLREGLQATGATLFRATHVSTLVSPEEPLSDEFSFLYGSCLMSRSAPFDRVGLFEELPTLTPRPSFALLIGKKIRSQFCCDVARSAKNVVLIA
jgi:hypothetical protein